MQTNRLGWESIFFRSKNFARLNFYNIILFLLMAQTTMAAKEALIDIDFGHVEKPLQIKMKGEFQGSLPQGVIPDFPAWCSASAETVAGVDHGTKYLSFRTKHLEGSILFAMRPETLLLYPDYYLLQIRYRTRGPDHVIRFRRQLPPFFSTYAEVKLPKSENWSTLSVPVSVTTQKAGALPLDQTKIQPGEIRVILDLGEGEIDIARLQVFKATKDEFLKYARADLIPAPADSKNFFGSSRFPLGLPSGWRGIQVVPDPENIGPSGVPSLKIYNHGHLYSGPFLPGIVGKECTVSFSSKGQQLWAAILDASKKTITSQTIPPSGQWERRQLKFRPIDELARGYTLFISGHGWVDAVTANYLSPNGEYYSDGDCEIALAPGEGEFREHRLHFVDEPAEIVWLATGSYNGAFLNAKVVNVYGEEKNLPRVKIPENGSGSIRYDVFPARGLGVFRLEVWAEMDGKRISPFSELVMTRIRRPVYEGKDAPDSPFGIHFGPKPEERVKLMKAAGVNWVRMHDCYHDATNWAWIEKQKGNWQIPDDGIDSYRRNHVKVLGWLGGTPKWASVNPDTKRDLYSASYSQVKDIPAFRDYVRKVVSHFRGKIDEWQFWNEPWIPFFWNSDTNDGTPVHSATPGKDYARLSKIAYEELKKVAPEVRMYGFSTAQSYGDKIHWTRQVYDAGAYPYCDMMDYHQYESTPVGYPGDRIETAYPQVWNVILEKEKNIKPVVMSEGAFNPAEFDACGIYNYSITWKGKEKDQAVNIADLIVRYNLGFLMMNVKRIFLYSDAYPHYTLNRPNYPCLLQADGYPRPTLPAYSNMAWLLEDRKVERKTKLADGVWSVWFVGKGKTVAVITGYPFVKWTGLLPESSLGYDLFGNPFFSQINYQGQVLYVMADDQSREYLPGGTQYGK